MTDERLKQWEWETRREPGEVACHTLVAGRVLCRWWEGPGVDDINEPPEARLIAAVARMRDYVLTAVELFERMKYEDGADGFDTEIDVGRAILRDVEAA